jgi:hypothetical protein
MESTALSKTPLILRFSTVAGELGATDAERDIRGFAKPACWCELIYNGGKPVRVWRQ